MPILGPIVVGAGSGASLTTAAGGSRVLYRRALARSIGPRGVYTTTGTPSGIDAERILLCSTLQDDGAERTRFDRRYVYIATGALAGSQSRVLADGFDPASGQILATSPFTSAGSAVAAGSEFELAILPAVNFGSATGLNEVINDALGRLPIRHLISVAATTKQLSYPLAAYPWPIKSVSAVYEPRTAGVAANTENLRPTTQSWQFRANAEQPVLELSTGYLTGQSFWVELVRGADTWIASGGSGVWANSSVGLASDSDVALYDVTTVVNLARPLAYEVLRDLADDAGDEKGAARWDQKATRAWGEAAVTRWHNTFLQPGPQTVGGSGYVGSGRRALGYGW